MKIVISFTTSPTRIHKTEELVKNLTNQTLKPDLILLNIPKVFARTKETYNIPSFISDKIKINIVEKDVGPATKVVPTIKYLNEHNFDKNNTKIIYIDDDILYPKTLVEAYSEICKPYDNSVFCAGGFNFINFRIVGCRQHLQQTTIAEGYASVCVSLSLFEDDFDTYFNNMLSYRDNFLSDDMILSNYFAKKKSNIYIFNVPGKLSIFDLWSNGCILEYGNEADALHLGANNTTVNNVNRYRSVIKILGDHKVRYIRLLFSDRNGNIQVR